MAKTRAVRFWREPEAHDFKAAEAYLSLVMPPEDARAYRKALFQARGALQRRAAKDILRAAALPLLPKSNVHVAKDLAKIAKGLKLSPVLLVRGCWSRPLLIADGYHRVVACEYWNENTEIACVLA